MILLLPWLLACAPEALDVAVEWVDGGVEVHASAPVERIEITDEAGTPVASRRLPAPSETASVLAPITPGARYRVRVHADAQAAERDVVAPDDGPVRVRIEAPVGQGGRALVDGDVLPLSLVGGAPVEVAVVLTARAPTVVDVAVGDHRERVRLDVPGAQHVVRAVVDGPGEVPVSVGALRATVAADALSRDEARARLAVVDVDFPVDARGRRDPARPADRIALPARWWERLLRGAGLGWRPRDDQAPWAWQAVTLENRGDEAMNLMVSAAVHDDDGPAPAFRSRLRAVDGGTDRVASLLRVPAGARATAVLPVFVDRDVVDRGAETYQRVVEVAPLGASVPLHEVRRPLVVTRGSPFASAGFGGALAASVMGLGALSLTGRRWLASARTADLVTIALFGALTFVVGTASQLVGYGLGTLLGPFSPFVTGLFDDAFRTCLLATLLVLVPRPGVVTVAALTGYLLRGLALGSFHPMDLLYFGSVVFWLEGALWVAGLTRDPSWRDAPRLHRWLRLSAGFATASVFTTATGLVLSVVLHRMYLATWFVALMLALPGFLYVLVGCWLAVDFSASLRRVER